MASLTAEQIIKSRLASAVSTAGSSAQVFQDNTPPVEKSRYPMIVFSVDTEDDPEDLLSGTRSSIGHCYFSVETWAESTTSREALNAIVLTACHCVKQTVTIGSNSSLIMGSLEDQSERESGIKSEGSQECLYTQRFSFEMFHN